MSKKKKGFRNKKEQTKGAIKNENAAVMQQLQMVSNVTMQTMQSVRVLEQDFGHLINNTRLSEVTTAAKLGDSVMIDFLGRVEAEDGLKLFQGGKGKGFVLNLGSKMFIDGFEEQLVGFKAGETTIVKVDFPEDYNSEELKGKTAVFDVVVLKVLNETIISNIDELEAKYFAEQTPETTEEVPVEVVPQPEV